MIKNIITAIALALGISASSNPNSQPHKSIYDFKMIDIDGNEVSLSKYEGCVLIIVNVASKCGLTPQYAELQAFYQKYADKNVVVLGFPANNFLWQEPGTNAEIKQFCSLNYEVTFPIFAKISVKGKSMHPLYKYLTEKKQNNKIDAPVTWNFQKFLIDRKGQVVTSFAPKQSIMDTNVIQTIESVL